MLYRHQISLKWAFQWEEATVPKWTKKFHKRLQEHAWQERRHQEKGKHSPNQNHRAVIHQLLKSCWNLRNRIVLQKHLLRKFQNMSSWDKRSWEITHEELQKTTSRDDKVQLPLHFHYCCFSKGVKCLK